MCARSVPLDIRRPSRVLTPTIVVYRLHLYSGGLDGPPTDRPASCASRRACARAPAPMTTRAHHPHPPTNILISVLNTQDKVRNQTARKNNLFHTNFSPIL